MRKKHAPRSEDVAEGDELADLAVDEERGRVTLYGAMRARRGARWQGGVEIRLRGVADRRGGGALRSALSASRS
jgi:hypothetical protein